MEATSASDNGAITLSLPTFNPDDDTVVKHITRNLFHAENRVTREEAVDFNYRCNLGVNLRGGNSSEGEEKLKLIIKNIRSTFESYLRSKIESTIKQECNKRGIKYLGQPITRINQLSNAWAADVTLKDQLWHSIFGVFALKLDWENEFEQHALRDLKYAYIDDDGDIIKGTVRRGNKGCIAKLATKVKREIVKCVNRKTGSTHQMILVSGTEPEVIGEYANGQPKYKKRTNENNFTFDEQRHCVHRADKVSKQEDTPDVLQPPKLTYSDSCANNLLPGTQDCVSCCLNISRQKGYSNNTRHKG